MRNSFQSLFLRFEEIDKELNRDEDCDGVEAFFTISCKMRNIAPLQCRLEML
jgi:hypothetical protein